MTRFKRFPITGPCERNPVPKGHCCGAVLAVIWDAMALMWRHCNMLHVLLRHGSFPLITRFMGATWGRQDPGGPHVGPMNFVILVPFPLPHMRQRHPQPCCRSFNWSALIVGVSSATNDRTTFCKHHPYSETEILAFWRNLCRWLHPNVLFWQQHNDETFVKMTLPFK